MKRTFMLQWTRCGTAAALVLLLLGTGNCLAEKTDRESAQSSLDKALEQLINAKYFALGGVGFGGLLSPGENALRTLASNTNAMLHFHSLLEKGTPAGKLYALAGLRKLKAIEMPDSAKKLLLDTTPVTTMSGCIVTNLEASQVAAQIMMGTYDDHLGLVKIHEVKRP